MLNSQHLPQRKPLGGKRPGAGRPPGAPNKLTRPVRELAADYSEGCIDKLVELRDNGESEHIQLAAAIALLDRAHGRPRQEIDLTKDDKIVVIVNRGGSNHVPVAQEPPSLEDHSMKDGEEREVYSG